MYHKLTLAQAIDHQAPGSNKNWRTK